MHPDFNDPLPRAPVIQPDDPFIVLGAAFRDALLEPIASNETLAGAQRSAELAVSSGRMVETLVVERVCRVYRSPPAPPFVTDFFDKD